MLGGFVQECAVNVRVKLPLFVSVCMLKCIPGVGIVSLGWGRGCGRPPGGCLDVDVGMDGCMAWMWDLGVNVSTDLGWYGYGFGLGSERVDGCIPEGHTIYIIITIYNRDASPHHSPSHP